MESSRLPLPNERQICAACYTSAIGGTYCTGCMDSPGPDAPFNPFLGTKFYCTETCRRSHWIKRHMMACGILRERRNLFRAGKLLQEMFYTYREHLFDKLICKVETVETAVGITTLLHGGQYRPAEQDHEYLEEFPNNLFPNKKNKQAALVHLAGEDAAAWFKNITNHFLKDLAFSLHEKTYKMIPSIKELRFIDVTGHKHERDWDHVVINVELKLSREVYVLDLAGAQYGYHDPVIPLQKFNARTHKTVNTKGGDYYSFCRDRIKHFNLDQKDAVGAISRINLKASQDLECAIIDWERKSSYLKMENLLDLPQDEFDRMIKHVVGCTGQTIQGTLDKLRGNTR